jgi:hypothetical protein
MALSLPDGGVSPQIIVSEYGLMVIQIEAMILAIYCPLSLTSSGVVGIRQTANGNDANSPHSLAFAIPLLRRRSPTDPRGLSESLSFATRLPVRTSYLRLRYPLPSGRPRG